MLEEGGAGGEMGHIYNSEASSYSILLLLLYISIAYLMIIQWIIDILKVVELKNGHRFVTVILTIEYDGMVHLTIRSLEIG